MYSGTALWLFHLFLEKQASVVLIAGTSLKPKNKCRQAEGMLATYFEVLNFLLSNYTTDYLMANTDAEMTTSKGAMNMDPVEYSQSVLSKELECRAFHDVSRLKGTFTEGLHRSIRQSMRPYWRICKFGSLQILALYITLLRSLQFGSTSPATILFPE